MTSSLNELHSLLRKNHRNRTTAGVVGFCLNIIPIVVGTLTGVAIAATEIMTGIDVKTAVPAAETGVSEMLSVDLSTYRAIVVLTSNEFLKALDKGAQERVECAVQHGEFKSLASLKQQVKVMIVELEEEKEILPVSRNEETELRQRFNDLAAKSRSKTISAHDAISELQYILQIRFKKDVNPKDVQQALVQQVKKKTGRFSFDAYLMAFSELKKLCLEEEEQKVPAEP